MSVVLSELYYLPSIEVFAHYVKADSILLEAHEHYQKGSYRNRTHIVGANSEQRLSIPLLKGKHSKIPIQAIELAFHEPWFKVHWKSIRSAYGNAPFFFYYSDVFEAIYQEEFTTLWSFNLKLLHAVFELLQWDKKISETHSYQKEVSASVTDIRGYFSPTNKPLIQENIQPPLFAKYPQVFSERHGFIPNLSILDLLFCMGPQSDLYLQGVLASK